MPWSEDGQTFETFEWPFIEAANYGVRRSVTRGITIHTPETSEMPDTALGVARYFASGNTIGSTQTVVDGGPKDGNEIIQCVYDSFVAHGAPGTNHDMLHVEIAGTARQSVEQWDDDYSNSALDRGADVCAQWALKYGLPLAKLSNVQLKAGHQGLCGHNQVSEVYKRSDHWDPGPNFPWHEYMQRCHKWYRHHLSLKPGFQKDEDKPDFRVGVVAADDLSAGMGRVYAYFNGLVFLRTPHPTVSLRTAIVVGGNPDWRAETVKAYEDKGVKLHVIYGGDRAETAMELVKEMKEGYRSADLDY